MNARNNSPRQDEPNNSLFTNFDMDISPGVSNSDNMNTISDNPTPETLNSSSNTAFTPPNMDQSLLNGQSTKNMTNPSITHFNTSIHGIANQADLSFSPFFDMPAMNIPMEQASMENSMPSDQNWSNTIAQPTGLDNGSFDIMDDANNFSDSQFDLLLRGVGWNGYEQPTGQ